MSASSSYSHSQEDHQRSGPSHHASPSPSPSPASLNPNLFYSTPSSSQNTSRSHPLRPPAMAATPAFTDLDSFLNEVSRITQRVGRNRNLTPDNPTTIWLHGSMCKEIVSAYSLIRPRLSILIERCKHEFQIDSALLFAALKPALHNLVAVMMEGERFVEWCKCERNRNWDHGIVWMQKALCAGLSTEAADTHLHNFLMAMCILGSAVNGVVSTSVSEAAQLFVKQQIQPDILNQFWDQTHVDGSVYIVLKGDGLDRARNEDIDKMGEDLLRITSNMASQGDDFKQDLAKLLKEKLSDHESFQRIVDRFTSGGQTVEATDAQHEDPDGATPPMMNGISYPVLTAGFFADLREVEILERIHPWPGSDINIGQIVEVYKVRWRPAGPDKMFALKRFWGGAQHCFELEAPIHLRLQHHPNIVQCLCAFRDEDRKSSCLLLELMDKNLAQHIEARGRTNMTLAEQIHIMLEIAKGMEFLHSKGIIHRDLKPENVLINDSPTAPSTNLYELRIKIADFSISKPIQNPAVSEKTFTKQVGTSIYRAPEVMTDEEKIYGTSVDVFSFAMVCFKILSGSEPFEGEIQRVALIRKGKRPDLSKELGDRCPRYLQKCIEEWWDPVAEKRPTFKEICRVLRHVTAVVVQCRGPGLVLAERRTVELPTFLTEWVDMEVWLHVQAKARHEMQRFRDDERSRAKSYLCTHSAVNEIPYEMHVMTYLEKALIRHIHKHIEERSTTRAPGNPPNSNKESKGFFKNFCGFCLSKAPMPRYS